MDDIDAARLLLVDDTFQLYVAVRVREDTVGDDHAHIDFRRALDVDADLSFDVGAHGILARGIAGLIHVAVDDGGLSLDDLCRAECRCCTEQHAGGKGRKRPCK